MTTSRSTSSGPADTGSRQEPVLLGEFLIQEGLLSTSDLLFALRVQAKLRYRRRLGDVIGELGLAEGEEVEAAVARHRRARSIGDVLLELGLVNPEELEKARQLQAQQPSASLEAKLLEEKIVDEHAVVTALSAQLEIPIVTPRIGDIDNSLLAETSLEELRKLEVLPLARTAGGVRIAIRHPRDEERLALVRTAFGDRVELALATGKQIHATLDALEVARRSMPDSTNPEMHVARLIDGFLQQAYKEGASDVHIEPLSNSVRVRFRIDGILVHRFEFPKSLHALLLGRIKVLAEADIAERRRHQDGRMAFECEGRQLDVRTSFYVTIHGESASLRILGQQRGLLSLPELGFAPAMLRHYLEEVVEPETGIVVMTGPTGSGKTTTLSSSLAGLNRVEVKIITAENPVEYQLDGVVQCQINPQIGLTYEETLRAILRQDPNIVVLGEVRDRFSADTAIQASLTGHKVFTTLHTEDSVGGLLRMMNMGIETFNIASTVRAVIAQRLLRRTCVECARPYQPSKDEARRARLMRHDAHHFEFLRGTGCDACDFSGYHGRVGVFEILLLTDAVRDTLVTTPSVSALRDAALRDGNFVTLREDALAKAVEGHTTLEEVARHTPRTEVRPLEGLLARLGY